MPKVFNTPGHVHALTFSCYRRLPLLKSERTCRWLAESIEAVRKSHDVAVFAYVFMPEHVHLVIQPRQATYDMAAIRKAIKHPVSRRALAWLTEHGPEFLPKLMRQRGARTERLFWQSGGGYDRNLDDPQTLRETIEYVHANPVRRGLVSTPVDWLFSSARWYATGKPGPVTVDVVGW